MGWRAPQRDCICPPPFPRPDPGPIFPLMAKSPGKPGAPRKPGRDPAKHSKKDPAKPTRAKAARPEEPPTDPALANLLNPAIGRGEAGPGSQTGLKPPPDNSWDRRRDFAEAHRARKSTQQSFNEAPQATYSAKGPLTAEGLGPMDPDLARQFGIEPEDETAPEGESRPIGRRARVTALAAARESGVVATAQALETLLREGRPEFTERPWVPHRPPRPEKSEGGFRLVI